MKHVTDIINERTFTLSVEVVPPRNGSSLEKLFEELERLKGKIDFASVTKGAGGSLRGGTLPIAFLIQSRLGVPAVAHFVCREHTKPEIENELTDLHYLGIANVLALRGDAPAGQKDAAWDGDYHYAYLLCQQISAMNDGRYLPRINVDESSRPGLKTGFCILVAGHPEDPPAAEIDHLRAKIAAGGQVIITQMIFSCDEYDAYVANLRAHGIVLPVIAGFRPLVSIGQAESAENFFKLKIPDELKRGLKEAASEEAAHAFGVEYAAEQIRRLREGGAAGAHLFVLNDVDLVLEILDKL